MYHLVGVPSEFQELKLMAETWKCFSKLTSTFAVSYYQLDEMTRSIMSTELLDWFDGFVNIISIQITNKIYAISRQVRFSNKFNRNIDSIIRFISLKKKREQFIVILKQYGYFHFSLKKKRKRREGFIVLILKNLRLLSTQCAIQTFVFQFTHCFSHFTHNPNLFFRM